MILLLLSLILFITLRFSAINRYSIDYDTCGHLYFSYKVKQQKIGPYGKFIPDVLEPQPFSHPYLWHWFIGIFGHINAIFRYQHWINPVLDVFFLLVYAGYFFYTGFSHEYISIMILLYALTPGWFSNNTSGPRLKSFTPRLFSEQITSLFFLVISVPFTIDIYITVAVASVLAWIVMSSSKFGRQAILFITLVYSVVTFRAEALISLFLGCIMAIITSRGEFFNQLKTQYQHLKSYYINNKKGVMPISNRSKLKIKLPENIQKSTFLAKVKYILLYHSAYNGIYSVILRMPIVYFCIFSGIISLLNSNAPALYFLCVLSAFLVYSLINLRLLLFLGESERYLHHVIPLILLTSARYLEENIILLTVLLLYGLIFWWLENGSVKQFKLVYRTVLNDIGVKKIDFSPTVDDKIIEWLSKIESTIVVCYPYHAVGIWRIMLQTNHRVVFPDLMDSQFRKRKFVQYESNYPYIDINKLSELKTEFGVDYFIGDRNNSKGFDFSKHPNLTVLELPFNTKNLVVAKIS
jgi:hypothetical protein